MKFRSVCEALTVDEPKDRITRCRIDKNGDISLIGRTPADEIPWGFTLSPKGGYLLVTASQGATITAYQIGTDGSLQKMASIPCDTGITDIVVR